MIVKHKVYGSLGSMNNFRNREICYLNFSDQAIICKPSFTALPPALLILS